LARFEFAILGAGALGTIIGAHLVRAGHSVAMLARGGRAGQLRAQGMRIIGLEAFSVPAQVVTEPAGFPGADVLLVATKAIGTAAALAPWAAAGFGASLSIQNGVMKDDILAAALGRERVLGALADVSGELRAAGEVEFTRNVRLPLGEITGPVSARALRLAGTLERAGIRAEAVPDIVSQEWTKFVYWVGMFFLSITVRLPTWRYLTDPGAATVLVRLLREMASLAAARGIELCAEAAFPVAVMCRGTEAEAVQEILRIGERYRSNAPQHKVSALQDVEAGRPLEIEETLGHAVELARTSGLALPLLEAAYQLGQGIDRAHRAAPAGCQPARGHGTMPGQKGRGGS
jgi:2-dehydropantoate 2-reductase